MSFTCPTDSREKQGSFNGASRVELVENAGMIQEIISNPSTVIESSEDAENLLLTRGQYRIKTKYFAEEKTEKIVENQQWRVKIEDEYKRVYIHKLNIVPTSKKDEEGNFMHNVIAVITLLDNPVWLVPALWALTAIGGTAGGYFLVDKVEEYTTTTSGTLVTLGATILFGWIAFKSFT